MVAKMPPWPGSQPRNRRVRLPYPLRAGRDERRHRHLDALSEMNAPQGVRDGTRGERHARTGRARLADGRSLDVDVFDEAPVAVLTHRQRADHREGSVVRRLWRGGSLR